MTVRVLPYVLALVLGVGAAGLSACGSSSSSGALIPAADAGPLRDDLAAVASAIEDRDCPAAADAVRSAEAHVDSLPRSTSEALMQRLREGLETLRTQAAAECLPPVDTTTTETTPTETTPTDTLLTETLPSDTLPTDTLPTDTLPTETTPTPTPTPDPGGASDRPGNGNGNGNAFGQGGA